MTNNSSNNAPAETPLQSCEEKKEGPYLRVTCYGSSSSATPKEYVDASRQLGRALAEAGHVCVNGGGRTGCMSGMTDGAIAAGGKVVGVIHEMFLVDRADFAEDGPHASLCSPLYELVVAGGNDLQERKKKLVGGADAIVVMPGGPGTWDELWEMACSKNIGLLDIPIVCVNVKGFYDDFEKMLRRAQDDGLLYRKPEDLVHFENTSEGAVRWIEAAVATVAEKSTFTEIKRRDSNASSALKEIKLKGKKGKLSSEKILSIGKNSILTFGAGLVIGLLLGSRIRIRS